MDIPTANNWIQAQIDTLQQRGEVEEPDPEPVRGSATFLHKRDQPLFTTDLKLTAQIAQEDVGRIREQLLKDGHDTTSVPAP